MDSSNSAAMPAVSGACRAATGVLHYRSGRPTDQETHRKMRLDTGDTFPALTLADLDGNDVTIPDVFDDGWGVVLMYRGDW